ncbi:ER membrane protein complex subunit 5-like [Xenia sp. Carnegie-2017]|uniref:ER membrane protein complex subunit 5-like n=1 Tax=Xenia sp. Carnegie-2017 TaxID=2897299 RepID=UPI001F033A6E|nr:ER membrane protein complex subunit 5-like [Xenia sp. Carnegie-2017]
MGVLGKLLVFVGLITIIHAGYSSEQYRTYLKLIEEEFTSLPKDIVLQCVFGLILGSIGAVNMAGAFKEIKASADLVNKSWETVGNRQSFYSFHHRGKVMMKNVMTE